MRWDPKIPDPLGRQGQRSACSESPPKGTRMTILFLSTPMHHCGSDGSYTNLPFPNQLVELLPEGSVAKSWNKDASSVWFM